MTAVAVGSRHDYATCRDDDCDRYGCVAYKTGYADGNEDGFEDGYEDGRVAGFEAGFAAGRGSR
ncbi:MAG: hypothetical protein ACRDMV_25125 [Streptosporangiales bacterium]